MPVQDVAALDRAHACRRSRHDQIAGPEGKIAGKIGNDFRHLPDELVEIAFLPHCTVDFEPDGSLRRMPASFSLHDSSQRCGVFESLADLPGPAELLALTLKVSA